MVQAQATARYVRTSAQKAGLVLALIRGVNVTSALATLEYSRKLIARDIAKVLRSAIANAQQKEGFGGDVERLYVASCYANQGPSQKRIRPAPMGRAFRVIKRTAHLTVQVSEKPQPVIAEAVTEAETPAAEAPKRTRGAKPKAAAAKGTARKKAPGARKKASGAAKKKSGARKKTAKS